MTFENMNKPHYNIQYCNFLKRQALALIKYVLARATLFVSLDTQIMAIEGLSHQTEWQEGADLICLMVLSQVDHFSNEHLGDK